MPFIVISGTYHLVGRTQAGNPSGFEPDGDSIQFKPADSTLLDRLHRIGRRYKLTSIGSTQLRFEGIDSLELHFDGTHQPRPRADEARDFLTEELDMNPVPFKPPENVRVQPPAAKDATLGFHSFALARGEWPPGRLRVRRRAALSGRIRGLPRGAAPRAEPQLPVGRQRAGVSALLRHALFRSSRRSRAGCDIGPTGDARPLGR